MPFSTYTLALLVVALMGVGMWGLGWSRRDSPSVGPYLTFTTGMIVWLLAYAWELEAPGYASMLLAGKVQYLAIPMLPVAVFWFALLHTGRSPLYRLRWITASYAIPVVTSLLAWTNDRHGLIWSDLQVVEGADWSVLDVTHGGYFWVHTGVSYLFMLTAMGVVIPTAIRSRGIWQRQMALLVVGLSLPWIANFLSVFGLSPIAPVDGTPFAFAIAAIVFGIAGLNLHLLRIAPLARDLVIDTLEEGIVVVDARGLVIDVNGAGSNILGTTQSDAVGQPATEVLGPFLPVLGGNGESNQTVTLLGRVFDCSNQPVGDERDGRGSSVLLLRDVTRLTEAQWAAEEARDMLELRVEERTEELVAANERITEEMDRRLAAQEHERRLEAQLRHTQKLDTIGTLVGGIAHDFNNLLAVILGYTELASRELEEAHPVRNDLDQAVAAAHRARSLVGQILTFSRRSDPERVPIRLEESIQEAVSLLKAVIPATIEIEVNVRPTAPVLADPTQMQQVLMNLCSNASQAMPTGGRLSISLSPSTPPLNRTHGPTTKGHDAGGWVSLRVEDSGQGMDEGTLSRVFDPFFTTKKVQEGTGLGLSVVRGIVTGHEGEITAESTLGAGTTFTVFLPTQEVPATPEGEAPAPAAEGRVLLIDDESLLLRLWRRLLERGGYGVTEHRCGSDALEALRADPYAFDVVLTDLHLPRMKGTAVAEEVQQIRPGMPVLLMSGNAPPFSPEEKERLGIRAVLPKPLEGPDLLAAVGQALATAASSESVT